MLIHIVYKKVRYDANSQFNEHGHPDGEEILVLEGSWQGEVTEVDFQWGGSMLGIFWMMPRLRT